MGDSLLAPPQVGAEPLQSFVKTVTGGSTGGLDVLYSNSLAHKIKQGSISGGQHTQALCLKLCSPSLSVISAAFMAFCHGKRLLVQFHLKMHTKKSRKLTGKSCLLAKTKSKASRSSSSFNILWSSSRASLTRSLSLESTTKIIPWVFWK